jgi:hypothetical protein
MSCGQVVHFGLWLARQREEHFGAATGSRAGPASLDKDAILERLFESRGTGDGAWRRKLSRESDRILQAEATASQGAVLVSHWRLSGMHPNSGTPTRWLLPLSAKLVNVHCKCPVGVAVERFVRRQRHPGHLDNERAYSEILATIRDIARLGRLKIGTRVDVDTSSEPKLEAVLNEIRTVLQK